MSQPFNLSNPDRPIHIGVILMAGYVSYHPPTYLHNLETKPGTNKSLDFPPHSVTELMDVAPIDMLHGLTKTFLDPVPDALVPPDLKSQALEKVHFHWVSEAGPSVPSRLTSGLSIIPTV